MRETMAAGLAPASTARLVAAVRGFYRFQRLAGAIAQNPADDLHAPRTFAALPRFLSLDDVDRAAGGARRRRRRAACATAR